MLDVGEITRVLAAHPVVSPTLTRSSGEACALLSRRYKNHSIAVSGDGRDFDFLHATAAVPPGSFNILRYGSGVTIDPGDFDQFYMLEIPLSGGVDLSFRDRAVASDVGHGLIISPGQPLISVWRPGTVQMMLKIDRGFMVARLAALTGRPAAALMFEPVIALERAEGWRIRGLMSLLTEDFLTGLVRDGWGFERTAVAAAIVDTLITSLPHDQSEALAPAAARILPRHVKRCVRYIEAHFAEELPVSRLAEIAESSERSLYEGFRHFLDASPQQYVADRRLAAAREMLAEGREPVAAVARRCGFHHPSRFARLYRERYGEYPSQTVKRAE